VETRRRSRAPATSRGYRRWGISPRPENAVGLATRRPHSRRRFPNLTVAIVSIPDLAGDRSGTDPWNQPPASLLRVDSQPAMLACGAGASHVARRVGGAASGHDLAARGDGESILDSSVPISLGWTPRLPVQRARLFLLDKGLKCDREGDRVVYPRHRHLIARTRRRPTRGPAALRHPLQAAQDDVVSSSRRHDGMKRCCCRMFALRRTLDSLLRRHPDSAGTP